MNIDLAELIIKEIVAKGVKTFCVAPGGRCAPFVEVLSRAKNLEVLYFFDERAAGFFAVGRAEAEGRAVAIITTSGTALAELLPSVIESHYSGFPLVLLTSDRPVSHRKEGCPQTLKKPLNLFKEYVERSVSVEKKEDVDINSWLPYKGSLHLNISFDKPLLDRKCHSTFFEVQNSNSFYPSQTPLKKTELDSFFKKSQSPILLIGGLRTEEQKAVNEFLKNYKGLIYAEPFSHITEHPNLLLSGERILSYGAKEKIFDGVIRMGFIPRCNFWKDLEKNSLPVLNLSSPPFYSGISRESLNSPLRGTLPLLQHYDISLNDKFQRLKDYDRKQFKKWQGFLKSYPESEPYWIKKLHDSFPNNASLFLGNSLPIRLWDLISSSKKSFKLRGQVGVNGIDGLISRFLGGCRHSEENIAIIGDLSTLYDISALWKSEERPPFALYVVNNFGGQIFSQLFSNTYFLNQHHLSFQPLAKMWGLDYQLFKSSSSFYLKKSKKSILVEIHPDEISTKECLDAYQSIWEVD